MKNADFMPKKGKKKRNKLGAILLVIIICFALGFGIFELSERNYISILCNNIILKNCDGWLGCFLYDFNGKSPDHVKKMFGPLCDDETSSDITALRVLTYKNISYYYDGVLFEFDSLKFYFYKDLLISVSLTTNDKQCTDYSYPTENLSKELQKNKYIREYNEYEDSYDHMTFAGTYETIIKKGAKERYYRNDKMNNVIEKCVIDIYENFDYHTFGGSPTLFITYSYDYTLDILLSPLRSLFEK